MGHPRRSWKTTILKAMRTVEDQIKRGQSGNNISNCDTVRTLVIFWQRLYLLSVLVLRG